MKKLLFLLFLLTAFSVHARPGLLDKLGLDNDMDVPPDVDVAFVFSAKTKDPQTIIARWDIAEGNYLYRDKIKITLVSGDGHAIGPISVPRG